MREPRRPLPSGSDPTSRNPEDTRRSDTAAAWRSAADRSRGQLDGRDRQPEPWGWNPVADRNTASPPKLNTNSNWVQIPHETMRELRNNADDRQRYETVVGLPSTGSFTGYPVHLIDGKWYVDLTPRGVLMSPNEARELLHIQERLEVGTTRHDVARDLMQIWDGEGWIEAPGELLARRGLLDQSTLTPEAIRALKEALVEHEEEAERLALRQLLAESQSEEDEGDGDD
jgi:hypothetical protein